MRVYTIHLGPIPELAPDASPKRAGRELVLVKEGFCWPAYVFTVLWALYHRMWLTAVALLVVGAVLSAALEAWAPGRVVQAVVSLGCLWLVGTFANGWRRRVLTSRGYEEAGVVAAAGLDAAEHRVFERLGARLKLRGAA
jgi:hypothetical protein